MKNLMISLSFVLVVMLSGHSSAQDLFSSASSADLSQLQEKQIELLQSLPTTDSLQIVKINTDLLVGDDEFFASLQSGVVLGLARTEAADVGNNVTRWTGETPTSFAMAGGAEGQASLAVEEDQVSGTIWTTDGVYSVEPLPGGLHALIKVNTADYPADHPPEPEPQSQDVQDVDFSELRPEGNTDVADIRVLVAVTPSAAQYIGNTSLFAQSAVDAANLSYRNSNLHMKLTLAGVLEPSYAEGGSHDADLDALVAKSDGKLDEIHAIRDEMRADIVVLLNDDDQYCGLARKIYAGASSAFATVHFNCAVANLSFAHEVGHLLGACHDPSSTGGCWPFDYGHGFQNPPERVRTVMAYPCSNTPCQRMPQWARPPLWGNENRSHDARVLEQTAWRASKFR